MDSLKLHEAASLVHATFGEASPIAMKLFAMRINNESEKSLNEFLGTSVANGQVPLSQLANIAELLQPDARALAEAMRDEEVTLFHHNMKTERKRTTIEKILRDPAMNKESNHAIAKMIQIAPATVAKVRKEMEKSGELPRMEKIEVERDGKIYKMKARRKSLEEEQLDRAVDIVEAKIEFKPYGTGMVRVEGIPDNGIHRGPIIINEHVASREHNIGPKPSPRYDIAPILNCIFHNKKVHGISNRSKLQEFSASISELRIFSSGVKHGIARKKITERILKIAYVLNGECVAGLPTR